jgi:hypothetical protein
MAASTNKKLSQWYFQAVLYDGLKEPLPGYLFDKPILNSNDKPVFSDDPNKIISSSLFYKGLSLAASQKKLLSEKGEPIKGSDNKVNLKAMYWSGFESLPSPKTKNRHCRSWRSRKPFDIGFATKLYSPNQQFSSAEAVKCSRPQHLLCLTP